MPIRRSGWTLSGPLSSHRTVRLAIHSTSASRAARPHFHSWSFSSRQIWLNSGASMPSNLNLVPSTVSVSPSETMGSAAKTGLVKIKTKPAIQPRMKAPNVPNHQLDFEEHMGTSPVRPRSSLYPVQAHPHLHGLEPGKSVKLVAQR